MLHNDKFTFIIGNAFVAKSMKATKENKTKQQMLKAWKEFINL